MAFLNHTSNTGCILFAKRVQKALPVLRHAPSSCILLPFPLSCYSFLHAGVFISHSSTALIYAAFTFVALTFTIHGKFLYCNDIKRIEKLNSLCFSDVFSAKKIMTKKRQNYKPCLNKLHNSLGYGSFDKEVPFNVTIVLVPL